MTKKLKKFLVCIISVFCVAALGFAIGCADSSSLENEMLTGAEERVYETDNVPINDPSCCEEGHMVQTLAASKVTESHQSHSSAISSSTTTLSSGNWYLSSDVRLNSYINVTGSVHLCLNGHTLTGGSNSVIVVNGGTLYLHDCQGSGKITGGIGSNIVWTTGGSSQSMGGGITVANGGTLHMYGGTITGNKAGAMGGGVIVAYNSNMIMYGGTISNNTGGWLGNGGVGVLGYFLMTGGTISGNSEPSSANGFGGGVSVSTEGSYAGTFEMTGGTISGNSSKQGAGVYAYTSTSLKITGGTISGNTASAEGGGIYALVNTTISGATITGNTTTISSSSYGGGGISVPYGTATISNCTITDNKASNGCGGGICVNSGCTATLSGCTITGNSAGKTGGGIYFSGTLKISGKMVVHSNTTSDIYLSSNQYVTLSGNLSSGSDVGIYFASSSQTQATASESGTSYYKNSYSYFFPDNKSGYFATYSSYVYFTNSGGYFESTFNLTSSSSSSTTRTYSDLASAVGTASAAYNSSTTVKVLKAVSVSSSVTIDSGTSVTFNTNGYKVTGSSYLFSVKGSLTITGSGTITGCSSSYGAIYVQSGGSLTISNGTLSGNYSSTYGGAVYIASSSASFTMSGGTIQNNTALKGGAGIYLPSKATATFTGGTVYNNTVSGSANNIYLSSGATIKFNNTSGITASKLGVTAAGTSSSSVQITNAVSGMSSSYINKYIYADSCSCACVKSNAIYFADSHNYEITGFEYVDGTSGCTATATNKCSYCGDSYTTSGMAVTYGFENGNAYRYVAGYEQFKEYFYSGALVLSGSVYTLYDNLSAAVDATVAGDTVYLLDDNNSSGTVTITKNVTIDLNGHAVGSGITASGATVTITDGLGGATVTGMLTGTFVLQGGTYSATSSETSDYLLSILDWTDWSTVVCYVSGTDANATYTITEEATARANAVIMVSYKASSVERHVYFDTTAGASSLAETCSTDSVLTLVVSVTGDVSVSASDCSVAFETAGYTLTGSVNITAAEAVVEVAANGSITGNVTISASETDVKIASSGSIGGTATFSSGDAELTLASGGSVGGIVIDCASATINLNKGSVSGDIEVTSGSSVLDLGGGTVKGDISLSGTAELLVEDSSDEKTGEVEGSVVSAYGLVLHGGTYTCSSSVDGNYDVFDYVDWENSYVCNFVSKSDSAEKYIVTTGSKAENGGNAAVVSYARDDGTEVKVYFESLADAAVFAAEAESASLAGEDTCGYTLTLIDDITLGENESLTITSSLTLDLNGKMLDGSITVSGNDVTVTIVDNSAYGRDRGYNDGTVTGTISVTGASSTLNITAGTYYHLPDSGYLPSCTAEEDSENYLEKNYVAAVNTITDINGNERRVYVVMTERTALEIAADAYSCTASCTDGNYKEDAESTRTYYIKLEDVLFDLSTTGGMIVICRDAVSETEITLKNTDKDSHENGILLVIDVNGHTIDVNIVIEADYVVYDETEETITERETACGAGLVVTNNSTDADSPYAKITGTITVDGLSEDYELEGPDDQDYTPWAMGVSLGSLENEVLDDEKLSSNTLEIEDTATLSADVVMSKSWATYAGVVEWSSSNTGVATVSTNWTDTSSGDDAADLKAKLSATVTAVGEGTADITATVTGKNACDKYKATVRITVLADTVVSVKVSCQDADDDGNVTIKLPEDTTELPENSATATLTATVTMSREGASYGGCITWTSLNTAVATVGAASGGTATAVVKGLKAGVTYVTATAGGVESDPIMITVENATIEDGDIYGKDENGAVAEDVYLLTGDVSFNGATFKNEDDLSIVKRENSDGDYDYIITGPASTMTYEQATAFGGDAEEDSSYVIFAITVPVGSSIYNASGSLLWTNENDNSPEDYYGVIMQVHSDVNNDRTYTVKDGSGNEVTYHIVFDYVNVDGSRDPYVTSITLVPSETTFVAGSTDNSVTFRVIVTYSDNDNTKIPDDLVWCVNGSAAECGVITRTTEGTYSYTVSTEASCTTIWIKTGSGDGDVSSNTVTISVVENIPTISATIVISETTSTGTTTTSYSDLLVGHDYNLSVDGKYSDGSALSGDVIWKWTSGSGSVATVEYDEATQSYILHAVRTGTVQLTATATEGTGNTGGDGETVLYEVTVTLTVSEDPTAESETEEKKYTNSYDGTLTFMGGVEPNDDLRVVVNLESSIEDNMGYNFMELKGEDGTGTGVYGIVSGHVHHYTEPVWTYSPDGTVTLRFKCDCMALELDEEGDWVEYTLNVNVDYSSGTGEDENKSVTKNVTVDGSTHKVTVEYTVSVNITGDGNDARDYVNPDEPYETTITIEAAVMVQFTDGSGNVVATLYFTDAATAISTAEKLLGDTGLGYGSAVVTLLSDIAEDLEISSGKITVNLNGFDINGDAYKGTTGSIIVSDVAEVTIENVFDTSTDSEGNALIPVHGVADANGNVACGNVSGEIETDGVATITAEGGTYRDKDIAKYVDGENYVVVYNGDGTYSVVPACAVKEGYEASVVTTYLNDQGEEVAYTIYYKTLDAALEKALDGDKVTVLQNTNLNGDDGVADSEKTYVIDKDITLDVNGKTVNGGLEICADATIDLDGGTVRGDIEIGLDDDETTTPHVEISLNGGTVEGKITVGRAEDSTLGVTSAGADVEMDLGGGKIYGDITVSGGSSLTICDTDRLDDEENVEEKLSYGAGLVIGEIVVDETSSLEVLGGSFSADIIDSVTSAGGDADEIRVVFIGEGTYTDKTGGTVDSVRIYTVMDEDEAKGNAIASRTYTNSLGEEITVYYENFGDLLEDLETGDVVTILGDITPDGGSVTIGGDGVTGITLDLNGHTITGSIEIADGAKVDLDLGGGEITGDVAIGKGADVNIDLDAGTIGGDVTVGGGASLSITDGSGTNEGKVIGSVVEDAGTPGAEVDADISIDAGTYGNDVLDYITEGRVMYVNSDENGNTYTVTTAEDAASRAGATVTYDITEDDGTRTVTVYFEDPADAIEYAIEVSDGDTVFVDLYTALVYDSGDEGIVTEAGDDIVIDLHGNGITGNITVSADSKLTIDDTDPRAYEGDIDDVGIVNGTITVQTADEAKAAGGDAEKDGELVINGGIYTDDIAPYIPEDEYVLILTTDDENIASGRLYEIVSEKEAEDEAVVSVRVGEDKTVYYADVSTATEDIRTALEDNPDAEILVTVWSDNDEDDPFDITLPSGDITIDFNGNTLTGGIALGGEDGNGDATLTFTDSSMDDETGLGTGAFVGHVTGGEDAVVTLEGGTFNSDTFDFDEYCGTLAFGDIYEKAGEEEGDEKEETGEPVDSYVPVYSGSTFTVVPGSVASSYSVASVETGEDIRYFTDIDDALGYAAENGGTLILYSDVTANKVMEITSDVVINLNGHSLVADVVIYADAEDDARGEGGSLRVVDVLVDTGTSGGAGDTGDEEDEEPSVGRLRGTIIVVGKDGYEGDNPYGETLLLGYTPMDGDLVVIIASEGSGADENKLTYYVFSKLAESADWYYGIVPAEKHVCDFDIPVWEYMDDGTVKLTFKCACGEFDDSFEECYLLTAVENEDGTVTFTAEAVINSNAHRGTYVYKETFTPVAKVNVGGKTLYFDDIALAIEAAKESGATLILMDDAVVPVGGITISGEVTIDLGGHDLSGGDITVAEGAILEIEGEGYVDVEISVDSEGGARMVVRGGTYNEDTYDAIAEYVVEGYVAVEGSNDEGDTVYSVYGENEAGEHAEASITREVNGETETTYYESLEDALNALQSGDTLTLWSDVEGTLVIDTTSVEEESFEITVDLNGHDVRGGIDVEENADTSLTIDDSSADGDRGDGKVVGGVFGAEDITINGGTFASGAASGDVSGGEYDDTSLRESVAEGKVIFNNEDGSFSVVDKEVAEELAGAVVTWTDSEGEKTGYYEILQDAVSAAAGIEDATVILYGDNPSDITVPGDVTIDLNGHTQDGDVTVNTGATLTLTDSSEGGFGTVDGNIIIEITKTTEGGEVSSGEVILSGGTYDFGSFDDGTLKHVSLGTDENSESLVVVYGDLETFTDDEENETVSGTFTVMTEGDAQNSGAVKVTVTTEGGDGDMATADVYFKDIESALEYASETGGKVTLYGDASAEDVIEITGEVEIDLNGHTLDADMVIDAVNNPEAGLNVSDTSGGEGKLNGTVTVILDDDALQDAYDDTFTVDGEIAIDDLDVSLKDGSADGDVAENFVFEGIDSDGDEVNDYYGITGIADGVHEHAYELVSMVYDEATCTVTIVVKCACGDVLVSEPVEVTFGEYAHDNEKNAWTVTGSAEISADADFDGSDEDYGFTITLVDPEAKVVVTDGDGNETEYFFESLEDAITFAAENVPEGYATEIILLADVENIIVTGDADVTIDLDGHTVTGTVSVDEDASLRIKGTGEMNAGIDVRGDLTIEGGDYNENTGEYEGQITIYPDDSIDVAEGGVLTIEGVVEIVLDGTDLDIGSTYAETEDGDGNAEIALESGIVIGGDLTITVKGDSTLSAEGELTITDDGSLTINIMEGTLTIDTDGNAIETEITVGDGASLVAKDTSGSNEGRIDGTVTVEEGGYAAFEDETFADYFADEDDEDAAKLDIVFDSDDAAGRMMESSANENGDRYYRTTTEDEHTALGHSFDIIVTDGSGNYVHDFDASMSQITLHFTCLCGEELYCTVDLAEDDYYAAVLTDGDGNEYVFVRYSLTAEVVSASGAAAWYPVTGTATLEMFERADNEMRRGTKDYFDTFYKSGEGDVKYYYGCDAPDCYSGGQDIYIYGTQRGIVIREDVPVTHYGLEEVVMEGTDHTIWHCTDCGGYFVDGNTSLTEGDAYDFSELEKELEREQIFNETRDELLEELYEKLTGCMGDSGTIMDAYNKAVEEISGWEYEFGGGSTEECDEYLETLLSDMDDVIAEAEFTIAEENQKAMSEISLEDLFGDFFDEDGNLSEKYEGYYSEDAQQQIKELYETALQDLGNFGFSTDDVGVTDSDSRYSEYVDWLDEMYGAYVQRIADELKSVDVIKVDTHEELSDEETIFSYVSNEDGMSGAIKLIITKVDGGKLDKAIGKATVVSGDTDENKMTEEEMQAALKGKSVIGVYDFKLWDTLSDVQVITFNGYYYVCLQLPEELQGRDDLQIVYLGDDGILEVYRTYTDLDAGCLYFTTTHFSQYIIMGVEEKDLMPPIIVLSVFGGMELIALVILIAVFVVRKKKENVVEESAPAKKKLASFGILPLLAVIIPTGAVGIIIGLAVANALLIAGIIVFIYLILTKTGKGVVEYELGSSSDGIAPSGAATSLQDGLASNCSAIDEAKRNNS